jgi:hypothetical protein
MHAELWFVITRHWTQMYADGDTIARVLRGNFARIFERKREKRVEGAR